MGCNRTFMELKYWSKKIDINNTKRCNRTFMELKYLNFYQYPRGNNEL